MGLLRSVTKVLLVTKGCGFNDGLRRRIALTSSSLAGHSKWANIKHTKAEKDAQKSTEFGKIARQLRLAIQEGGSANPATNTQLRSIIDYGLRKNMPMASIQNNIKKFQQIKTELKRYRLDVRFKQKVFVVCIIYTDNYTAFRQEAATILRKSGAMVIDTNNLFEEYGIIEATMSKERLSLSKNIEELATEDAIECGAEEVEIYDTANGVVNFVCQPRDLFSLRKSIESKNYIIENMEHIYTAVNCVELPSEELVAYEKFITKLRQISGVEEIYDNLQNTNFE
uniref:Uncharacterized protein n=1 Tax=Glossina brevipalpis TaxID=37001 RepID=A0A1A9WJ35_9MUSC